MSIVSLSIKGGSEENIAQVDKKRKKNLFKHNTSRSIYVLVRIHAKMP